MFTRFIFATLALLASVSVQAAPEWVALAGTGSDSTFVNRTALDTDGRYVDVEVLRNFTETITLGSDPESGAPLYPHRSVTLSYKVDCAAARLAVSEWQMFEGNLASGKLVWNQNNAGSLAFLAPVNAEMRAVLRSACATNTVLR